MAQVNTDVDSFFLGFAEKVDHRLHTVSELTVPT